MRHAVFYRRMGLAALTEISYPACHHIGGELAEW